MVVQVQVPTLQRRIEKPKRDAIDLIKDGLGIAQQIYGIRTDMQALEAGEIKQEAAGIQLENLKAPAKPQSLMDILGEGKFDIARPGAANPIPFTDPSTGKTVQLEPTGRIDREKTGAEIGKIKSGVKVDDARVKEIANSITNKDADLEIKKANLDLAKSLATTEALRAQEADLDKKLDRSFNKTKDLRDAYEKVTKDNSESLSRYRAFLESIEGDDGISNHQSVINMIKMGEPNSNVMGGEFQVVEGLNGFLGQMKNMAEQVKGKGKILLDENLKKTMKVMAAKIMATRVKSQIKIDKVYEERASRYNLNPKDVIRDFGQEKMQGEIETLLDNADKKKGKGSIAPEEFAKSKGVDVKTVQEKANKAGVTIEEYIDQVSGGR